MPFTDEEVAELAGRGLSTDEILKAEAQFDAQSTPKLGSFYEELTKPGFAGDVVDAGVAGVEQMGALFTKGVHNAMNGIGAGNPVGLAVGLGQALYEGVDSLPEAADRSAGIAAGLVPGGQTGYQYAKDLYNDEVQPGGQYGKMLRGEAAGLVASAPLALAGGVAGRVVGNRGARTAARTAAIEDPASQAAMRFAKQKGHYNSLQAQRALERENYLHPQITGGAELAVLEAKNLKDIPRQMELGVEADARDALPGQAFGSPESNSARSKAMADEIADVGPAAIESHLFDTDASAPYNLETQSFDPVPAKSQMSVAQVAEKSQLAGKQILEHRRNVVDALDMALDNLTHNSRGTRTGGPVTGITFHGDILPNLSELQDLIAKRATSVETVGMSESMQIALNNAKTALDNLGQNPATNIKDPLGGPGQATGYAKPSEVLGLIENLNAYRRSLGEFDNLARAKGIQGDKTTLANIDAETRAITQVQKVLQEALENKAKEILSLRSEIQGQPVLPNWKVNGQSGSVLLTDVLKRIQDNTLAKANKNFQAFSVMEDMARARSRSIVNETGVRGENTLIKTEQETPNVSVMNPLGTFTDELNRRAGEYFFPQKTNPNMERAARIQAKVLGSNSQIIDGLLIRDREVPLLSRSWEKVKMSPDQLRKLDMMAVGLGLIPPNTIYQMSEPMQAMLHSEVVSAAPMAADSVPGGYDVAGSDGLTFQRTPQAMIEQDFIARKVQNAPLSEQARVMSAINQGKYVPLAGEAPPARTPPPPRMPSIGEMSGALRESLDRSFNPETRDMLDELNAKAERRELLQDKGF